MKRTQPDSTTLFIPTLPTEIWVTIFSHLEYAQTPVCERVCKLWKDIINHDSLVFEPIFKRRFSWIDLAKTQSYRKAYSFYDRLLNGKGTLTIKDDDNQTLVKGLVYQNYLISGSTQGEISLYNCDDTNNKLIETLQKTKEEINDIVVYKDYLCACDDNRLHIWNAKTKQYLFYFENDCRFELLGSNEKWLFSADWDEENEKSTIQCWDIEEKTVAIYFTFESPITTLQIDNDNLIFGDKTGKLGLLDLTEPKQDSFQPTAHSTEIYSIVLYENFIISCASEDVKVWDRNTLAAQENHPLELAFKASRKIHNETFLSLTLWDKMLISTALISDNCYVKLWNFKGESHAIPQLSQLSLNATTPILTYQNALIAFGEERGFQTLR
jgi:WD40 repeat protein